MEVVIFDVGGFSFGAEVTQIISIVRPCEEKMEQIDESVSLVDLSMQLGTGGTMPLGVDSAERSTDDDGTELLLVDTTAGMTGVTGVLVRGVVKMPLEQIEPLPEFLKSRIQTDCIWGIGKLEKELIILLDLDRYLLNARC